MTQNKLARMRITNIISKANLIHPFSLSALSSAFPFSNEKTSLHRIYIPYKNTNFSIFRSGSIISRSSISQLDLKSSFEWLRFILVPFELKMSRDYEILNIVSTINLTPPLELLLLAEYLPNCSYDPSPILNESNRESYVDAIVYYFIPNEKPRRTALIFSTGNMVLTGFNSFSELNEYSMKLSRNIFEISQMHPEVIK